MKALIFSFVVLVFSLSATAQSDNSRETLFNILTSPDSKDIRSGVQENSITDSIPAKAALEPKAPSPATVAPAPGGLGSFLRGVAKGIESLARSVEGSSNTAGSATNSEATVQSSGALPDTSGVNAPRREGSTGPSSPTGSRAGPQPFFYNSSLLDKSNDNRRRVDNFPLQKGDVQQLQNMLEAERESARRRITNPTREELPDLIKEHEGMLAAKLIELSELRNSADVQRMPPSLREGFISSKERTLGLSIDRLRERIARFKELEVAGSK